MMPTDFLTRRRSPSLPPPSSAATRATTWKPSFFRARENEREESCVRSKRERVFPPPISSFELVFFVFTGPPWPAKKKKTSTSHLGAPLSVFISISFVHSFPPNPLFTKSCCPAGHHHLLLLPAKIDEEIVSSRRACARPDAFSTARPRAAPPQPPHRALAERKPRGAPQELVLALHGGGTGLCAGRGAGSRQVGSGLVLRPAAGCGSRRRRGAGGAGERGVEFSSSRAATFGDAGGDCEAGFTFYYPRR